MKKEFRRLLQEIASRGHPTREEVKLVWYYLQMCSSENWRQAFGQYVGSPTLYVSSLATIFNVVYTKVQEQQRKDEEEKTVNDFMDVTFIAHGTIMNPKLPCTLYYMKSPLDTVLPYASGVNSINLYEPWGCAIDASVVYGIATGLIDTNTVQYTDVVLPSIPSSFNKLPNDNTHIPIVVFTHVRTDEGAYQQLMELSTAINAKPRGLVIPYFQSPFDTDLPEIPLWALCNVLDVTGFLTSISINIHVAACFTTRDASLVRVDSGRLVVDCDQYCTVPVSLDPKEPPTIMTCTLSIPQQLSGLMATLDRVL